MQLFLLLSFLDDFVEEKLEKSANSLIQNLFNALETWTNVGNYMYITLCWNFLVATLITNIFPQIFSVLADFVEILFATVSAKSLREANLSFCKSSEKFWRNWVSMPREDWRLREIKPKDSYCWWLILVIQNLKLSIPQTIKKVRQIQKSFLRTKSKPYDMKLWEV